MNLNTRNNLRLVDVSHTVEHGMITYKGLPAPLICDFLSREESRKHYAEGTEFQIGKIELVANTGTYLDTPFHRYSDGTDLAQIKLSQVAGIEGVVIRARNSRERAVDISMFREVDVSGKAVLIHTGWDAHWGGEQYFEGHPFLTKETAQLLKEAGALLVGIDSYNIDDTADAARPVHSILLKAGIYIVEHLCNLAALPRENFEFFAVPVKVRGMGTFPVRAFGIVK